MLLLPILTMLSGSVTVDHQPIAEQSILVIDAKADSILYSGTTDEKGNFSWQFPEKITGTNVYILAKFRTSTIVSAESCELTLSNNPKFNLNVNSNELENIKINLSGDSGIPKNFTLKINAESISGIPENLNRFLVLSENNVAGYFYNYNFQTSSVCLKFKKGIYHLYADCINYNRHSMVKPNFNNYIATKAICDGHTLEGNASTGFKIDSSTMKHITLQMSIYND